MYHMWDLPIGMGWWTACGGWWTLIFWGGLIALAIWGITRLTRRNNSATKYDLLDVAKGRYARGEVSREEFEQIKKDLS